MNKFSSVWVFSDTPSRLPELMSGAQAVGEKVNAFVLNEADSATACHLGADHVWLLSGKPEDRMIEDYAAAMAETIMEAIAPPVLLLDEPSRDFDAHWLTVFEHWLATCRARGTSVVAISHDAAFTRRHFSRVVRLENGRLSKGE